MTVFVEPSGTICHSRCQQPLAYQGTRGRLEVDFYCLRCVEHVSLPLRVLPRIPEAWRRDLGTGVPPASTYPSAAPVLSRIPAR